MADMACFKETLILVKTDSSQDEYENVIFYFMFFTSYCLAITNHENANVTTVEIRADRCSFLRGCCFHYFSDSIGTAFNMSSVFLR